MRRMIVLFCLVSFAAVLPAQNAYDRTTPISEVAEDPVSAISTRTGQLRSATICTTMPQ